MKTAVSNWIGGLVGVVALIGWIGPAEAFLHGEEDLSVNPTFGVITGVGTITAGDGSAIWMWGYGMEGGSMQYPGPTLIVMQGAEVTVNLTNNLPVPSSMVFPGQSGVVATGDAAGELTMEANPGGGSASYTFTASRPGTYLYHSGTRPDLQVEMGLTGALIVRPTGWDNLTNRTTYGHPDSWFDYEYLMFLSEIDPVVHDGIEHGMPVDTTARRAVHWFINGRASPDSMAPNDVPWLPLQPYNALARTHPGERVAIRLVNAGRELHPFHTHGNNVEVIAKDGRLLESIVNISGPDLSWSDFTVKSVPGGTFDGFWVWTGEALGFDIYGHTGVTAECTLVDGDADGFADTAAPNVDRNEYCADHGIPFPVVLPELKDMDFGGWYSGSPFLGLDGPLPPGEGGLNLNGGLVFMWHSHTEKELVNNDVFPGGMMTMLLVEPDSVDIEVNGQPCVYITDICGAP